MQFHNRRIFLGAFAATAAASVFARAASSEDGVKLAGDRLAAIEAREGGRLGVAILDTGNGAKLAQTSASRCAARSSSSPRPPY